MANLITNFSFETDTSGWTATGHLADTHTVVTGPYTPVHGNAYLVKTFADAGASKNFDSDLIPVTPGQNYSFGVYARWVTGATPRDVRIDIRWANASGAFFQTDVGSGAAGGRVTTTTADWQQVSQLNALAPTVGVNGATDTATQCVVRIACLAGEAGEAVAYDAVRMNPGATLEPFGGGAPLWNFSRFIRIGV